MPGMPYLGYSWINPNLRTSNSIIPTETCMSIIMMLNTFQSLVSLLLTLNASRVLVVVLATGWGSYAVVTLLMKAMRSFLFTSITFATAQSFVAYMQVQYWCDSVECHLNTLLIFLKGTSQEHPRTNLYSFVAYTLHQRSINLNLNLSCLISSATVEIWLPIGKIQKWLQTKMWTISESISLTQFFYALSHGVNPCFPSVNSINHFLTGRNFPTANQKLLSL